MIKLEQEEEDLQSPDVSKIELQED
jgi:hypothetical protein